MRIAIFGANGQTGRLATRHALANALAIARARQVTKKGRGGKRHD